MRLYLSSYRIGDHTDRLLDLIENERKTCIISNALDHIPESDQINYRKTIYDPYQEFSDRLGIMPEHLDLRPYFDHSDKLREHLEAYDLVWVNGGNTFMLLYAMVKSGFKDIIQDMLREDKIVYGGFSAGACVAASTLRGIDLMDEPLRVVERYHCDPIWEALGLVDFSIVPHYKSNHGETAMANDSVAYFEEEGMPFKTLRDGGVIVKQGESIEILPPKSP